jgi:hypothetical protein
MRRETWQLGALLLIPAVMLVAFLLVGLIVFSGWLFSVGRRLYDRFVN